MRNILKAMIGNWATMAAKSEYVPWTNGNLTCNGYVLSSYRMEIARIPFPMLAVDGEMPVVWVTSKTPMIPGGKVSRTTQRHISMVRSEFEKAGFLVLSSETYPDHRHDLRILAITAWESYEAEKRAEKAERDNEARLDAKLFAGEDLPTLEECAAAAERNDEINLNKWATGTLPTHRRG